MKRSDQPHVFPARIHKIGIVRAIDVPKNVSKALGSGPFVPVQGWIEGLPLKGTLVPRGGGCYRLHVHSRIWRKRGVDAGDIVEVTLLLDTESREPMLPPEFAAALAETPRALANFKKQTTALRREIVGYIQSAKRAATHERRIAYCIRLLQSGAIRPKRKG